LQVVLSDYELSKSLGGGKFKLLIIDHELMPDEAFDTLKSISQNYLDLSILIITNKITKPEINQFVKIGIKSVALKTIDEAELLHAINATLKGKKYYSEEVLDLLMEPEPSKPLEEPGNLTPSEIEVVRSIAAGLTTKEIAQQKNISFHTVITHRKNIFRKLEINNSSELLMYAMRKGLIDAIDYQI
jgi:DNA-binding NarL/FixJ family response regulator